MKVHVYLNFDGKTEEAFKFYQSIFGGELNINKMREMPDACEHVPDNELDRVMHATLPLQNGDVLMASDTMPSAGHVLNEGNNYYVSIDLEKRSEAERIFKALTEDGTVIMPLEDTFWGAYFACFKDKYGIQWMINCEEKA